MALNLSCSLISLDWLTCLGQLSSTKFLIHIFTDQQFIPDNIAETFTEDIDRQSQPPPTYHGGPVITRPGISLIGIRLSINWPICLKSHRDQISQ